jgi:hypothetical protein
VTTNGDDKFSTKALCAVRADGLCAIDDPTEAKCGNCDRYADLLRSARELYADVAWAVTPEGVLQEIGGRRR